MDLFMLSKLQAGCMCYIYSDTHFRISYYVVWSLKSSILPYMKLFLIPSSKSKDRVYITWGCWGEMHWNSYWMTGEMAFLTKLKFPLNEGYAKCKAYHVSL